MMPHSEGEHSEEFKLAVVETELQQKLGASEYIASIYSWGPFDGNAQSTIRLIDDAKTQCPNYE